MPSSAPLSPDALYSACDPDSLGFAGSDNRSAVPMTMVKRWQEEGITIYKGETDDVRPFLAESHCVVLPSYREGLPRALLEAAAMARPMIATDVPGCSDLVANGQTGFLCAARSAASLAGAMERMLRLSRDDWRRMGLRARELAVDQFDQQRVVNAYLGVMT